MVRAWYMDESSEDQRLPHMTDPPRFVDLDELKAKTGILYYKLDAEKYKEDGVLDKIKSDRGYDYEDSVHCHVGMDNYESTLKMFFEEHLHRDEEIRFFTDGSGYFDVRDDQDKWIRIEAKRGDMLILPAGIYHRFSLDTNNYVKANRYFSGVPVWTPYKRSDPSTDAMDARKNYVGARS